MYAGRMNTPVNTSLDFDELKTLSFGVPSRVLPVRSRVTV
jgi:hypothetical protein